LLGLMTGYKFNLMGSLRSMDNLLQGFSVAERLRSGRIVGAATLRLFGVRVLASLNWCQAAVAARAGRM